MFFKKEDCKKDNWPLVSIIVLNYNGRYHLEDCLDAVLKTEYPNFEVLLVDNCSIDGSVKFVKNNYPNIKVISLRRNVGPSLAFMAGVLKAKGKYVARLDFDFVVDKKWLKHLIKFMESNDKIAIADPKFKSYYNKEMLDNVAAAGRYMDYFGNTWALGVDQKDRSHAYNKIRQVFIALVLLRRNAFLKIGGYDPDFFFGYEDIDLSWRFRLAGYKLVIIPNSIIYHKSGVSSRKNGKLKLGFYYFIQRNKLITLLKNHSSKMILLTLPVIFFEIIGRFLYFMFKRKKQYTYETFKALLYILKNIRKILHKRIIVQRNIKKVAYKEVYKYMLPYIGGLYYLLKGIKKQI